MNKIKQILPDMLFLIYVLFWAIILIVFIGTKDKLENNFGINASVVDVFDYIVHNKPNVPISDLEMPYMPDAWNFDYDDPSISYNRVKKAIVSNVPDKFDWTVSEEYDYIKLQVGWSISPSYRPTVTVISRDPYEGGKSGIGTDNVQARYNQTCSMRDVPYGSKIWLKGLNTIIVFIVTDNDCEEGELVLHQHDKLGELDGVYEVVKVSPPTTNYLPDTPSTGDFERWYEEWKVESRKELDRHNEWLKLYEAKQEYIKSAKT